MRLKKSALKIWRLFHANNEMHWGFSHLSNDGLVNEDKLEKERQENP